MLLSGQHLTFDLSVQQAVTPEASTPLAEAGPVEWPSLDDTKKYTKKTLPSPPVTLPPPPVASKVCCSTARMLDVFSVGDMNYCF